MDLRHKFRIDYLVGNSSPEIFRPMERGARYEPMRLFMFIFIDEDRERQANREANRQANKSGINLEGSEGRKGFPRLGMVAYIYVAFGAKKRNQRPAPATCTSYLCT